MAGGGKEHILLPPEKLNLKEGVTPCMSAWRIVPEGSMERLYAVERIADPAECYLQTDRNSVEGVTSPGFLNQEKWEVLCSQFQPRPDDVFIVTFPKCGTTLVEQIVLLLKQGGDPTMLDPKSKNTLSDEAGVGKIWPETCDAGIDTLRKLPESLQRRYIGLRDKPTSAKGNGKEKGKGKGKMTADKLKTLPGPRLVKSHMPRESFLALKRDVPVSLSKTGRPLPLYPGIKVIYVSRNAKDACVSAYYHSHNPQAMGYPFDAWSVLWMAGLFESGRWSDHVAGWRTEWLHNPEQVLWVRYEDILGDPEKEIERIATFIGISASDDVVKKTRQHSSFENMRAQAEGAHHMRKGVVGDHATHFHPDHSAEFDEMLDAQMMGIHDPYTSPKRQRTS